MQILLAQYLYLSPFPCHLISQKNNSKLQLIFGMISFSFKSILYFLSLIPGTLIWGIFLVAFSAGSYWRPCRSLIALYKLVILYPLFYWHIQKILRGEWDTIFLFSNQGFLILFLKLFSIKFTRCDLSTLAIFLWSRKRNIWQIFTYAFF